MGLGSFIKRSERKVGENGRYINRLIGGYVGGVFVGNEYLISRERGYGEIWGSQYDARLLFDGEIPIDCKELYLDLGMNRRRYMELYSYPGMKLWLENLHSYIMGGGKVFICGEIGWDMSDKNNGLNVLNGIYDKTRGNYEWGECFPWLVNELSDELYRRHVNVGIGRPMKSRLLKNKSRDRRNVLIGDDNVVSLYSRGDDIIWKSRLKNGDGLLKVRDYILRYGIDKIGRLSWGLGYEDVVKVFSRWKVSGSDYLSRLDSYCRGLVEEFTKMREEYGIVLRIYEVKPIFNANRRFGNGYKKSKYPIAIQIEVREDYNRLMKKYCNLYGVMYVELYNSEYLYEEDMILSRANGDYLPNLQRGKQNQPISVCRGELKFEYMDIMSGAAVSSRIWNWDYLTINDTTRGGKR